MKLRACVQSISTVYDVVTELMDTDQTQAGPSKNVHIMWLLSWLCSGSEPWSSRGWDLAPAIGGGAR